MSPEEIQRREFSSAMRGYDKLEVRDFLRRVAAQVSAAQNGEAVESEQSEAQPEVTPLGPEDDRFEALGDRIAGLLRSAHESAAAVRENADSEAQATVAMAREASEIMQADAAEAADAMRIAAANEAASLRTSAEDEAEQVRSQARAAAETASQESERLRAEAEQYKAETEADADAFKRETEERVLEFKSTTEAATAEHKAMVEAEVAEHKLTTETELAAFKASTEAEAAELREASLNAGETELAGKREETDQLLAEAASDREAAMSELADARAQVTELLEQARNQSDFLRHEADEIIRAKVRTQVERAEERLQVLRNSEVASRDRIATAHAELAAAMERLDTSPVPELASDTDHEVLEAAKARGEETNWGAIDAGSTETTWDDNTVIHDAAVIENTVEAETSHDDMIETDVIEAEADEHATHDADVIDHDVIDADVIEADVLDDAAPTMETDIVSDSSDEISMEDVFGGDDAAEIASDEPTQEMAQHDVIDGAGVESFEMGETDVVESAADEHAAFEPDSFEDDSFEPGAFEAEQMDASTALEEHAVEADDSELLSTFEVSDTDQVIEAPVAPDSLLAEAPIENDTSFEAPAATFEAPADTNTGHRHDDPTPYAEPESGYDGYESDSSDNADDRVPVAVGAEPDAVPENEDALARLVREAMQRAVDSARTGD